MRGVSWRTEGSKENLNRRRQRWTKGNQDRRSGMGLQQIPVWACNNLTFMCGAAPRLAFCLPPHHHKTGSLKRDTHTFVSFATFCSSPLLPFCKKTGLAFRDHHWLAQARKLYLRFPLLPSVQVLFSPSVRNQDWPSGIITGSHRLANYAFVFLCYLLFKFSSPLL